VANACGALGRGRCGRRSRITGGTCYRVVRGLSPKAMEEDALLLASTTTAAALSAAAVDTNAAAAVCDELRWGFFSIS